MVDCDVIKHANLVSLLTNEGLSTIAESIRRLCDKITIFILCRVCRAMRASLSSVRLDYGLVQCAARYGYLNIIKWARKSGYAWSDGAFLFAVKHEHYNVLDWAITQKIAVHRKAYKIAAKKGSIQLLKWVTDNDDKCNFERLTGSVATFYGHLNLLKWMHANNIPLDSIIQYAVATDRHNIIEWAELNGVE